MELAAETLTIQPRHGALRDLFPIYGARQLALNVAVLGVVVGFAWLADWELPVILLLPLLFEWLAQFGLRAGKMQVSQSQADLIEAALRTEGHYSRSDSDGRWRLDDDKSWHWPHKYIEFRQTEAGVTLIAPRQWLESMRAYLEWLEETGTSWSGPTEYPFQIEASEADRPPWHAHVPTALLAGFMIPAWFVETFAEGGMEKWGISAAALTQGRFETIALHMFAHGGLLHLLMNMAVLIAIGGSLAVRMGAMPLNWVRLLLLFVLSGLSGTALFLALHPMGGVPMLGASGAIYGLIGLLIRFPHAGGNLLTIRSPRIRRIGWGLVKENLFLIAVLGAIAWTSGTAGGLAWEAHLGGFLFGFFVGPKFLPSAAQEKETSSAGLVEAT